MWIWVAFRIFFFFFLIRIRENGSKSGIFYIGFIYYFYPMFQIFDENRSCAIQNYASMKLRVSSSFFDFVESRDSRLKCLAKKKTSSRVDIGFQYFFFLLFLRFHFQRHDV